MTTVTIPLDKNPDLAALIADKQPGDWIELRASLKSMDGQTVTLRLEECDDCEKPKSAADEEGDDGDEAAPEAPAAPAEEPNPAKDLAARLSSS